jgi:4-amino-4-deoxy-L-arabinose transferase-like glycosyltransferase
VILSRPVRVESFVIALLVVAFFILRLPLLVRLPAAQDEDFYAVPGTTIRSAGVPQIPYLPSRDPTSVFYHADQFLFTLPPLSFYLQAVAFTILGDGLGTARLVSLISGLIAALIIGKLARHWFGPLAALLSIAFLLFSRGFWITATTARPDMPAVACGLGALWLAIGDGDVTSRRTLWAGLLAGLGLLSHPIAAIAACQAGLVYLLRPAPWPQRFKRTLTYSSITLAVFALWLPLIAMHPHWFRSQFLGNIQGRAGLGLLAHPFEMLRACGFQVRNFIDHVGILQFGALALATAWAGFQARRSGPPRSYFIHLAAALALYLLIIGDHHIRTYYVYPVSIASIGVGALLERVVVKLTGPESVHLGFKRSVRFRLALSIMLLGVLVLLAPGAGLRVWLEHLRHAHVPSYDTRQFCRTISRDIPIGATLAVDRPYVFEFHLLRPPVLEAIVEPFFFDVRACKYDYVVMGRVGLNQAPSALEGMDFVRAYGDAADPFSNYAELYRRRSPNRADGERRTSQPIAHGPPLR